MEMRTVFIVLWLVTVVLKLVIASRLPLFVDEAFYWLEGQHPAWAYSDLPGLTAWLIRVGTELFGDGLLAVRLPFITISALVPWWIVWLTRREFGEHAGWYSGCLALLLPLLGSLGVMALPDAILALATVMCVDAGVRLMRGVSHGSAALLAIGLTLGALSHYRFIAVIGVGIVALVCLPGGRAALRDPRVWIAIMAGAAAWIPLVAWNVDNAEAGLRFQMVDRHPWALHADGWRFVLIQAAVVTPLLFAALLLAAWRSRRMPDDAARFLALCGALLVAGFFVLGFVADTERVSFHWPLPGYLALLPLAGFVLLGWPRALRAATWALLVAGFLAVNAYYVAVSTPQVRERAAASKWYPSNFAGWDELAAAVRAELDRMPADTVLVADNFKIGAELGFALGDPRIRVLDHPLNRHHGRAPQLALWGLQLDGTQDLDGRPALVVVGATDVKFSALLDRYQTLCARFGSLPVTRVVNADRGAQRFVLSRIESDAPAGACVTPAVAHIDTPAAGARAHGVVDVRGWAVKDVSGIASVAVTLDGVPVAEAVYGQPNGWVAGFLQNRARDPSLPDVGFSARVDLGDRAPGLYWLGLRITGGDGSVEDWAEQPLRITAPARTD
ncbi:glycosyltransferase family 39 protein [Luteimonas sp BLCC-B24]|uniref:glycosyltransferase family 39 protein n=1 Tax=Luteimonas sp. BLCC-B24 TaxID=3025317 RepID=UPI00234C2205|nr:glycosyltransferase family 39 protein [Luteimonas sp. BLCC-B24]MDC7805509.1 glycosyltransferase family 39 protein [Luteimonas sp. BLCC-B24]